MQLRTFNHVGIHAVSSALPEHIVDQSEFAKMYGEQEVQRICMNTGIHSKRVVKDFKTSQLMHSACESLFDSQDIKAKDIDALITVSQSPDSWSPGVGYQLHQKLGLNEGCSIFDLSAGCAGYITALIQACALITSGGYKNVIVCTGDVTSKLLDEKDRHVAMLFGDGATASLLTEDVCSMSFMIASNGQGSDTLGTRLSYTDMGVQVHDLHMDGAEVMNFALARVPALVRSIMSDVEITTDSLDMLVFHQANAFMLNYLRRMLKLEESQVPIDINGIGNTSSSSIPIVLSRNERVGTEHAKNAILCGFGVGLSWGAVVVDLSNTLRIPPVIALESEAKSTA
ncbi:hypothetical protein BGP78_09780 [Pseudoalteromonas sp. MSK9-3]|uniref:3-oxoacyl-ACP synthase III family protein n=1 Tax=Pseudoalteromonas sp. MSK9-3 TaxID=1897633 RepID=UPI000EE9EAB7|nr:ketoacyl-ACP synthase III [Pseudoalteromonas sp. MSK9-3]RJE77181.1 hypothetical protein BGP78_09780 [Pseudoalteromonas sp. MSK9-3]